MVKGHPDYQTQEGRNVGGADIDSFSFSGVITSGGTGTVTLSEVATGEEHFYQHLDITVPEDSFIHTVSLIRVSDSFLVWTQNFVTGGNYAIPGFKFPAGQQAKINIINNGDASLTFTGSIFRTIRRL